MLTVVVSHGIGRETHASRLSPADAASTRLRMRPPLARRTAMRSEGRIGRRANQPAPAAQPSRADLRLPGCLSAPRHEDNAGLLEVRCRSPAAKD